jgi:hypothetical protein
MTDTDEPELEQIDGCELEDEANALVDAFNDAAESYSPELEWFGMSLDRDTGDQRFVFEANSYVDGDGLAALRERGRVVEYIEAYVYDAETRVQISIPVEGSLEVRD